MPSDRRAFLAGGSAFFASAVILAGKAAGESATRIFHVYRGDRQIGRQELTVERRGKELAVSVRIDIDVRILGIPAYRYRLQCDEFWQDGALQRVTGRTDDDGTVHAVRAERQADGLRVAGSGYSGLVLGNPATTTYWSPEFLSRGVWISTQDGRPLSVRVSRGGEVSVPGPEGPTAATRWQVRGDIDTLDLFYDRRGEWVGSEFEARGQRASLVLARRGGSLGPLRSDG